MDSNIKFLRYSDEYCRVCNSKEKTHKCVKCNQEVCVDCIYTAPWFDYLSVASSDHGKCYRCLGWKQNESRCSLCYSPFTVLLFRHHCRECGSNICDYCSKYDEKNGKRVCHHH